MRPLGLSAALVEEVETCRAQFDHATVSVDVPEDVYVEGDDLIAELFSNPLTNAVRHNDKPTPTVSVAARRSDGSAVVTVADDGPGIPDEKKARVTVWDVRGVDSSGSGLGLAIAETVARRYDGRLRIVDDDPEGTRATVELPPAETDVDASAGPPGAS